MSVDRCRDDDEVAAGAEWTVYAQPGGLASVHPRDGGSRKCPFAGQSGQANRD